VIRQRITAMLVLCFLLFALSACGNKGPLVSPEEDDKQKTSTGSEY
jgi:predicted small lipoprotein YifL